MIISHFPHGPTLYVSLHNVQLRHDIAAYRASTVSEQYPHLIFDNFSSPLGVRVRDILKYLFPVPKEDSKRVMTFANESDFVSFRYACFHFAVVLILGEFAILTRPSQSPIFHNQCYISGIMSL